MPALSTFRYEAISPEGHVVSGTIDAHADADGRDQLQRLGLSLRMFEHVVPIRTTPLNSDDLEAFNDQLAQLARVGLPVEQGLKLLADDMSSGRLKRAVEAVSRDLQQGLTLPQAIDAHRNAFPPLYAEVVEAGIRVNNLPAVLFNLSKHLDLTRRIRGSISRAVAYPTMVLLAIIVVSAFISAYVLPVMVRIFEEKTPSYSMSYLFGRPRGGAPVVPTLPAITRVALVFGHVAPYVAVGGIALVVGASLLWPLVRSTSVGRWIADALLTRLPLFGPPMRFSMIGRWCDALRIGVLSGLDLPSSIDLAARTVGSSRLRQDTERLISAASSGARLDDVKPLSLLPGAVPAAIGVAMASNALPETLDALSTLYLRQAETRARLIPLVLTPLLVVLLAVVLGGLLAALFSPISRLLQSLTM